MTSNLYNHYTEARQQRMERLQTDADSLFSIRRVREFCQGVIASCNNQASLDTSLSENIEYCFALNLITTFDPAKQKIIVWSRGCQRDYLLQEAFEEREISIERFSQMKIASRWYQMKDDDQAWRIFAHNIPFGEADRSKEITVFFDTLNRICILTDILTGHAAEYGFDADYSKVQQPSKVEDRWNVGQSARQHILDQLLDFADNGDWVDDEIADKVKVMLKTILGQGETPLVGKEGELSEGLWQLLESGRGDRVRVTWQNMVGYFDDRGLLKIKSAPMLNMDFFGDKEGSDNINKGRPSRGNMPTGLSEVLPLLDAYVPQK